MKASQGLVQYRDILKPQINIADAPSSSESQAPSSDEEVPPMMDTCIPEVMLNIYEKRYANGWDLPDPEYDKWVQENKNHGPSMEQGTPRNIKRKLTTK